jgi:hypothetical protein
VAWPQQEAWAILPAGGSAQLPCCSTVTECVVEQSFWVLELLLCHLTAMCIWHSLCIHYWSLCYLTAMHVLVVYGLTVMLEACRHQGCQGKCVWF